MTPALFIFQGAESYHSLASPPSWSFAIANSCLAVNRPKKNKETNLWHIS